MSIRLEDTEIPNTVLVGCKTPIHYLQRVAVVGVLCVLLFHVSMSASRALLGQIGVSLKKLEIVISCIVVYAAIPPVFEWSTEHLRDCTDYHRFHRLFREEFNKKGTDREMAIMRAEDRLTLERQMRHMRSQGRYGVSKDIGNGVRFNIGGY